MACVDSDNFSANDLCLFIESIEKIQRMERLKQERQQQYRAQYLADTLRYLDQQYPASSSSTLSSTDEPEEESLLENIEEKEIICPYAVKDIIYNGTYEDSQLGYDSTCLMQNEYCQIEGDGDDDDETTIYSMPMDRMESTKMSTAPSSSSSGLYEQISPVKSKTMTSFISTDYYEEPIQVVKKKSLKTCLLGLVRRKYRKAPSSNTNNWCKSSSWMKLTAV